MKDNNRNFILAIVLSMVVLFGWQFFIAGPQIEQARKQQEIAQQQAADQAQQPAATGDQRRRRHSRGRHRRPATRRQRHRCSRRSRPATRRSPSRKRVPIDTPLVTGSINLTGGRVDDLRLNDYHETVDPSRARPSCCCRRAAGRTPISPISAGSAPADAGPLPGPTTEWTAPAGAKLTPADAGDADL